MGAGVAGPQAVQLLGTGRCLLTEAEKVAQVAKIQYQQKVMEALIGRRISELEGQCSPAFSLAREGFLLSLAVSV